MDGCAGTWSFGRRPYHKLLGGLAAAFLAERAAPRPSTREARPWLVVGWKRGTSKNVTIYNFPKRQSAIAIHGCTDCRCSKAVSRHIRRVASP
eukprot:6133284-Prymnesium_polylepis.1